MAVIPSASERRRFLPTKPSKDFASSQSPSPNSPDQSPASSPAPPARLRLALSLWIIIKRNFEQANTWLMKAAAQGNEDAKAALGSLHAKQDPWTAQ